MMANVHGKMTSKAEFLSNASRYVAAAFTARLGPAEAALQPNYAPGRRQVAPTIPRCQNNAGDL